MGKDIKVKLAILGKRQVDLLKELRNRGYRTLTPQALSSFISGYRVSPQSEAVLGVVRKILRDWEEQQ